MSSYNLRIKYTSKNTLHLYYMYGLLSRWLYKVYTSREYIPMYFFISFRETERDASFAPAQLSKKVYYVWFYRCMASIRMFTCYYRCEYSESFMQVMFVVYYERCAFIVYFMANLSIENSTVVIRAHNARLELLHFYNCVRHIFTFKFDIMWLTFFITSYT